MADVKTSIVQFNAATGGGNQNIESDGGLDGDTPKLVMIYAIGANSDDTAVVDMLLSIGYADGTNQFSNGSRWEDDQARCDSAQRASTSHVITIIDPGGTGVIGQAAWNAWRTTGDTGSNATGVQINWSTTPTLAFRCVAVFFSGADFDADIGTHQMPGADDTVENITAPGFEPDIVLFGISRTVDNVTNNDAHHTHTWMRSDKSATVEFSFNSVMSDDNDATDHALPICSAIDFGEGGGVDSGNRTGADLAIGRAQLFGGGGAGTTSYNARDFDSSGFSLVTRNSTGNPDDWFVSWCALDLGGLNSALVTSPKMETTGDHEITAIGFAPQLSIAMYGRVAFTAGGEDIQGSYCFTNTLEEHALCTHVRHGLDNSMDGTRYINTGAARCHSNVSQGLNPGDVQMEGTYVEQTADGFKINISNADQEDLQIPGNFDDVYMCLEDENFVPPDEDLLFRGDVRKRRSNPLIRM